MIRALVLWVLVLAGPVWSQDFPALHSVTGVAANDVLNIREAPDASAPIIGTLAPDSQGVEVVSITDGWAVVNTDDRSGYVARRFLAREAGPPWYSLSEPITCVGTEPFWSLAIEPGTDLATGTTELSTPEGEAPEVAPIGKTWPGQVWSPAAALSLSDGLAVLHPAECSDGMSERTYGISIDIFLQQGDRQRLSGCCVLGLRQAP